MKVNNDNINPKHYTFGTIECIDAMANATEHLQGIEAICTANAIQYLWRWKMKNGVEDLKKAVWHINHLIEEVENNTHPSMSEVADKILRDEYGLKSQELKLDDMVTHKITKVTGPIMGISSDGEAIAVRLSSTGDHAIRPKGEWELYSYREEPKSNVDSSLETHGLL